MGCDITSNVKQVEQIRDIGGTGTRPADSSDDFIDSDEERRKAKKRRVVVPVPQFVSVNDISDSDNSIIESSILQARNNRSLSIGLNKGSLDLNEDVAGESDLGGTSAVATSPAATFPAATSPAATSPYPMSGWGSLSTSALEAALDQPGMTEERQTGRASVIVSREDAIQSNVKPILEDRILPLNQHLQIRAIEVNKASNTIFMNLSDSQYWTKMECDYITFINFAGN